jgi:hypothetical protein
VEWSKATRSGTQNDLLHCADTLLDPGTVLYEALLHKLETRISAKVCFTGHAPRSCTLLSSVKSLVVLDERIHQGGYWCVSNASFALNDADCRCVELGCG